jgi:hypothetical protein
MVKSTNEPQDVDQKLASGRAASKPVALTGIVALVIWTVATLIAALLFVVSWLV